MEIWSDKIKCEFFQTVAVSVLLYGSITWTFMKHLKKKWDGNYSRMLHAVFNESWKQHSTKQWLYGHLLPIPLTIQVRQVGTAGKFISNIPPRNLIHKHQPAKTKIHQLCADTWCRLEDLQRVMTDRDEWWERIKEICAVDTWWWWWCVLIKMALSSH